MAETIKYAGATTLAAVKDACDERYTRLRHSVAGYETDNEKWYKIATCTISEKRTDKIAALLVNSTCAGRNACGILYTALRTESPIDEDYAARAYWLALGATSNFTSFSTESICIGYKLDDDNNVVYELWYYMGTTYQTLHCTVLGMFNRLGLVSEGEGWQFSDDTTGVDELPDGYEYAFPTVLPSLTDDELEKSVSELEARVTALDSDTGWCDDITYSAHSSSDTAIFDGMESLQYRVDGHTVYLKMQFTPTSTVAGLGGLYFNLPVAPTAENMGNGCVCVLGNVQQYTTATMKTEPSDTNNLIVAVPDSLESGTTYTLYAQCLMD